MTWQAEQLDEMQNTRNPKTSLSVQAEREKRPWTTKEGWAFFKPEQANVRTKKNSDQMKSNNKQACSAKLNQPEFDANAPLIGSVNPCREMSDLYWQVWK